MVHRERDGYCRQVLGELAIAGFEAKKHDIDGQITELREMLRIPTMPITHSDLMAITIPSDADHRRSEATLGISYHAEVIGISQCFCDRSGATLATSAETGVRGKGAQHLFLASAL
jgi:hypothetical protein